MAAGAHQNHAKAPAIIIHHDAKIDNVILLLKFRGLNDAQHRRRHGSGAVVTWRGNAPEGELAEALLHYRRSGRAPRRCVINMPTARSLGGNQYGRLIRKGLRCVAACAKYIRRSSALMVIAAQMARVATLLGREAKSNNGGCSMSHFCCLCCPCGM